MRFEKIHKKLEQGYGMSVHFFILVSIYCLLSNNVRVFKCLILLLLEKKSLQTYMEKLYRVFYLIYHTNMINKCINLTEIHPNIMIMYNKKMNKK